MKTFKIVIMTAVICIGLCFTLSIALALGVFTLKDNSALGQAVQSQATGIAVVNAINPVSQPVGSSVSIGVQKEIVNNLSVEDRLTNLEARVSALEAKQK